MAIEETTDHRRQTPEVRKTGRQKDKEKLHTPQPRNFATSQHTTFSINSNIPPERESYKLAGGDIGVLVLHGFMGSPLSSRPLAEFLNGHGLTVHCPRMAGHGHLPARLHKISHKQWLMQAEIAMQELQAQSRQVFLIGHSMGCVTGAYLLRKGFSAEGFAMIAPLYAVPKKAFHAMRLVRHAFPYLYPIKQKLVKRHLIEQRLLDFDPTIDLDDPAVLAWLDDGTKLPTSALDEMRKMTTLGRKLWKKVAVPTLILQGEQDEAVKPQFARRIFKTLASTDKTLQFYPDAGHELMRSFDPAHTDAWERIYHFIEQHSNRGQ